MTKRRLIRKADTERVTEIVLNCAAVNGDPRFYWDGDRLRLIEVPVDCGLSAVEIVRLGERGIHPGADGWEIEEAPAIARPPLPPGFGWYEHGHESYGLDVAAVNGSTIAKVRRCANGNGWSWMCETPGGGWQWADSLPAAKNYAEDACRAAGLFDAPTVEQDHASEIEFTPEDDPGYVVRVRARSDSGVKSVLLCVTNDDDEKARVYITAGDAERIASSVRRILRRPPAPTAPDLGAKVDAIHAAAGTPPTGAARALLRLALRLLGRAETGEYIVGDPQLYPAELAPLSRLCEAFVAELRASLPAPPMPSPRTTDGALTAYLLEHHRDAWRPGEDALALAIRLLGEASDTIADAREEARVADESAKELEAELARVRAALAKETERRVEAERGRGEALGDLAALRGGLRGLMARMGAPHG